jgi:hypothetical protein
MFVGFRVVVDRVCGVFAIVRFGCGGVYERRGSFGWPINSRGCHCGGTESFGHDSHLGVSVEIPISYRFDFT